MKLSIGKNIRKLREVRNVTQEQLAVVLNISFQAVSKWENEIAIPDTVMLPQIAEYFQVTIDDLFHSEIKTYPNLAIRLLAIYESSHKQDDFFRADKEFSKLIEGGEYTEEDLKSYGVLYEYHSDYCINKALELYQKALDVGITLRTNTYYSTQRQRIGMLSKLGRGHEIINKHIELLETEPDIVENHISLIAAYYYNKQFDKALKLFNNAILKWPDNTSLYIYGGDICKDLKEYDKAFEYWDKSIKINNEHCDAMYSKAFCYQELGDHENEKKMWNEIIEWLERRGYSIQADWPKKMLQDLETEKNYL